MKKALKLSIDTDLANESYMDRKRAKESNPFQVVSNVSTPDDIPAKKSPNRLRKNSDRNSPTTATTKL